MLSKNMQNLLNEQIMAELSASHLYMQMSLWCEYKGFKGFADYLLEQSLEEKGHSIKISKYILDRNCLVAMREIEAPVKTNWDTFQDVFRDIYNREVTVTLSLNNIYKIALTESDYCTIAFLKEFIDEQIKSESEATHNLLMVAMSEGDIAAMLQLDKKFSS